MANKTALIEVKCPCCDSTLQIDPELKAVISHQEPEKPHVVEDMAVAVQRLKGEEARRAEVFEKSFAEHKSHKQVSSGNSTSCSNRRRTSPTLHRQSARSILTEAGRYSSSSSWPARAAFAAEMIFSAWSCGTKS